MQLTASLCFENRSRDSILQSQVGPKGFSLLAWDWHRPTAIEPKRDRLKTKPKALNKKLFEPRNGLSSSVGPCWLTEWEGRAMEAGGMNRRADLSDSAKGREAHSILQAGQNGGLIIRPLIRDLYELYGLVGVFFGI